MTLSLDAQAFEQAKQWGLLYDARAWVPPILRFVHGRDCPCIVCTDPFN